MTLKNAAIIAVLVSAAFSTQAVSAGTKPMPPTNVFPWLTTDNDVFGNWKTENGEAGYEAKFSPDHTIAVYDEGYGAIGPFVSTWKLVNNHVIIANAYQYQGPGSEDIRYKVPLFNAGYGSDLQVIRVNGHTVLMPGNNVVLAQKSGYAPLCCFWHYTVQRGIAILPQDAIDLNKAIYKKVPHGQRRQQTKIIEGS